MTRALVLATAVVAAVGCKHDKSAKPAPPPTTADATTATTPAATALIVPLEWTVTRAGATSHVLATIDAGVDVDTQVPAAIWDQVTTAKTVILQWNLAEVTMPMLQRTDGGSLAKDLTADETAALTAALGAKFVTDLDTAKPSFVATVVSAYGLSTRNPLQAVINQKAQAAGRPTAYLETGVAQQALLDRWLDVATVKAMIAHLDGIKAGNAALLAAFVHGDAMALTGMVANQMPWQRGIAGRSGADLDAMTKATLTDRHAAWVTFLAPTLDAGGALVAVDAVDAVGPGGLIEQLRAAGYDVVLSPRQQ
jgi:uncharacterized protein YbaP (TraB family)